jgi:hypothetical protein
MARSPLAALRDFDARRPGLPGEHLLTFGAGTWLLRNARRRTSGLTRLLATAAGVALLARALSGRDGVRRLTRR